MNALWRLSNVNYLAGLLFLLGVSFQFSLAATNIFFYLLVLACLFIIIKNVMTHQTLPWKEVVSSRVWQIVTLWIVLLYVSITYSDAGELLTVYARKYAKYFAVGLLAVVIASHFRVTRDLPKYFFYGLIAGGVFSFSLAIVNNSTGVLTALATEGLFSTKYVNFNFWRSNEAFAYPLLMTVVSLYAVSHIERSKGWRNGLLVLLGAMGVAAVLIVSQQRTGYIALVVLLFWLLLYLIKDRRVKVIGGLCVLLLTMYVLNTPNKVSKRVGVAQSEIQRCWTSNALNSQDAPKLRKACGSNSGLRLLFYRDSIEQIKQSWLYGHGLAALNVRAFQWRKKGWHFAQTDNPHNEYLLQGIHLGIPGILLVIALFVLSYGQAMKLNSPRRYLYGGIVIMYSVSCLLNSFLLDATQGVFFVVILSFIIAERIHQNDLEKI